MSTEAGRKLRESQELQKCLFSSDWPSSRSSRHAALSSHGRPSGHSRETAIMQTQRSGKGFSGELIYAAAAAKSLQSCPTLHDPIDGSPPGSPIPGILQARTLEWGAISFSNAWK